MNNLLSKIPLKINLPKLIILPIFINSFFFFCEAASHFSPDRKSISRVHLVSFNKGNNVYLFRGTDPVLESKYFAYDALTQLMQKAASESNVPFPKQFYLVDFSLLFIEKTDISIERKFFEKNPNLGRFVNYPVFGNIDEKLERLEKIPLKQNIEGENLGGIKYLTKLDIKAVNAINDFMNTHSEANKPTIVYVHCVSGCDRTGEIIGGYRMQHMGLSLSDAYEKNTKECGRAENNFSKAALIDFCKYLKHSDCSL